MTSVIALSLCGVVGLYAASTTPTAADRALLLSVLLLPAAALAATRSTLLLDWFFILVVCNRLLRRLLDWGEGRFDELPLLSISPLIVAAMMVPYILSNWNTLSTSLRRGGLLIAAGLAYAGAVGVRNGLGAVFAAADYSTPWLVLFWCVAMRPSATTVYRWLTVVVNLGVLAASYGIAQWAIVPPWDEQWVMWSKMWSSMGLPIPYKLAIASTLESRGPAAWFFAHAVAIALMVSVTRRPWGLIAPLITVFAMLLTSVRTGLIYVVLCLVFAAVMAGRRGGWRVMLLVVVVSAGTIFAVRSFGEGAFVTERVATLGDIQNDSSAQGRVMIAQEGIVYSLTHPVGFGLGSGGIANRVDISASGAVGDNGYLELLSTLGVPGFALFFAGIGVITWPLFSAASRATHREPTTVLGRAMLIATLPVLMVFNCLVGPHASYVWVLLSRGLARPAKALRLEKDEDPRNRQRRR